MTFFLPPNKTQLEYIKKDLYRSASELEEDVTRLIEWLSKQSHLPNVNDRKWILHFIIGCKYSLQRSKQVIEKYFMAKAEFPEYFGSYTIQELDDSNTFGIMCSFPKLTPQGHRVHCTKSQPPMDDNIFHMNKYAKRTMTLLDLQLKEEPIYGNIFLYDLKYYSLSQFLMMTPTFVKNLLKCSMHSFPLRVKSIHILNPPKFTGRILALLRMFFPEKMKQRIFVHNSLEGLYQYVPKYVLPDVYGGTAGNIEQFEEYANELVMSNKKWLEARPKADLSKLPKHLKSNELEMNGTFKKLQVD